MSWQDIPIKAVNFTSFWLSNKIADGKNTLDHLFWYANTNGYKIEKTVLLGILDVMVNLRLIEIDVALDQKMTFKLDIPKASGLVAEFKKANF